MTTDEPLAGSTRRAARGLRQDVETVWSRLRAEFTLQDRFWIGFLFGAEAPEVAELVARSRDLALSEVRRVDVITLHGPEDVSPALGRLLAPHAEDLAMTWIADVGSSLTERAQIWTRLLRRLNERRDALREAHPRGLVLVCPSLRDLSISLNKVAGIQQRRGQLDEALNAYTESLTLRRRIRTTYGDTPESLRDLSISLDKVAGIQQQRGQLDEALNAYTEALQWYALLDERYGPPFADPDELAALQDAVASIPPNSSAR